MLPTERKALPSSCSSIIGSNRLVEQQGQVEQQQARVEHNFLTCFDSDNISLRCFDSVESSGQRMNQIKRDLGLRDCDDGSKDIDFSVYMTIPPRLLKQRVLMPGTQEQEVVVPGTQEQEAVTQEQEAVTQEQEVLPVKVYLPKKKKKQPKKGREPFQKLDWSLVTVPDNNTTPSSRTVDGGADKVSASKDRHVELSTLSQTVDGGDSANSSSNDNSVCTSNNNTTPSSRSVDEEQIKSQLQRIDMLNFPLCLKLWMEETLPTHLQMITQFAPLTTTQLLLLDLWMEEQIKSQLQRIDMLNFPLCLKLWMEETLPTHLQMITQFAPLTTTQLLLLDLWMEEQIKSQLQRIDMLNFPLCLKLWMEETLPTHLQMITHLDLWMEEQIKSQLQRIDMLNFPLCLKLWMEETLPNHLQMITQFAPLTTTQLLLLELWMEEQIKPQLQSLSFKRSTQLPLCLKLWIKEQTEPQLNI
ncbi:uncharacterized protein LOC17897794 [Capsella rubella]|uniref:uncharacterized protein LOC17897794 n=1 Tax=Capsella rubella TaxID=81985 RepID=UPI000CD4CF2A|nr:uncharacterized protein LOC17897794 [Capsella rubella]